MTRPNEERKAAVVHSACLPASLSRSLLSPSPPISSVFAHSEKHPKKAASRCSQSTCDAPRLLSCDLLRRSEGARHACTRTSCVVHRGRAGGRVGGSLWLTACGAGWLQAWLLEWVGASRGDTPRLAERTALFYKEKRGDTQKKMHMASSYQTYHKEQSRVLGLRTHSIPRGHGEKPEAEMRARGAGGAGGARSHTQNKESSHIPATF